MRLEASETARLASEPSPSGLSRGSLEAVGNLRVNPEDDGSVESGAALYRALYAGRSAEDILTDAITLHFAGRIALISSFGAEAAVLLHLVAQVDRNTPVLFGDTGMLFEETQDYRDRLVERLGLTDVRAVRPNSVALETGDADGTLNACDTDACCFLRKVAPMQRATAGFEAVITGRKRFHSSGRAALDVAEADAGGQIKLNPLAGWSAQDLADYMRRNVLPAHPLVKHGFASIGCAPCTSPVAAGEDPRAGRWRGSQKTECGIHFENGRMVRRLSAN